MIPWVSPSLLAENPGFEKLHKRLVTDILDHDCISRSNHQRNQHLQQQQRQPQQHQNSDQRQQQPTVVAASERSNVPRVSAVRNLLLAGVLFDLALSPSEDDDEETISKEVREASLTLGTYLHRYSHHVHHHRQQPDLLQLLLSDISTLRRYNKTSSKNGKTKKPKNKNKNKNIGPSSGSGSLSNRLLAQYAALKDIASASASTATVPGPEVQLPDLVMSQIRRMQELETQQLPRAQYEVTNTTVRLLRTQAAEMERLVRWLEQRRHGAEARYLAGRARWLATVARGMAAKARVGYLESLRDDFAHNGSQDHNSKIRQRIVQLEEEEKELEARKSQLTEALDEYDELDDDDDEEEDEEGKGGVMEQLGRRYAEIEREIEEVKADIERVRSSSGGGDASPQWVPPR